MRDPLLCIYRSCFRNVNSELCMCNCHMICGMCKHICVSFVSALYTRIDVEIESVSVLNLDEVEGSNKYECVGPSPS